MPLVLLAYIALLAGCAAGALSASAGVLAPCGVAMLAWGLVRRDARAVALVLTCVAGALASRTRSRDVAACRARAVAESTFVATIDGDAQSGERVAGTIVGCAVAVRVTVDDGRASAGARVTVRGIVAGGVHALVVRQARVTPMGGGSTLVAWRAAIGREIDALFASDAPLARALVIADMGSVAPDVRDRFADAGLVHLLSVSGLHVSLVATALELVLVAARMPRGRAAAWAVGAVGTYVLMIGAPAPAVRAGAMLGVAFASRALQRPTSPWAVLALGGTLPLLVDPLAAMDAGYQLSMAGMASLVAGRGVARRALAGRVGGHALGAARELVVSVVASLVTAPIVAWWFARVSLVGPIANLAAGPIVAALQPALFLAIVLAPVPALAHVVARGARVLMALLDVVARGAAAVPHASLVVAPSTGVAIVAGLAAVGLIAACAARRADTRTHAAIVAVACLAAIAWTPLLPARATGEIELHVLDVGQGDAIALRTPRGRWVLFDAGRTWRGGDAGRSTILPFLRRHGGALAAFVLSHPHADHVGGAPAILSALHPDAYWDAGFALGSDVYRASLDSARRAGVGWHRVHPDDSLVVDGVVLRVLAPDSAWTASLDDPNLASVVVAVRFGAVRFLLVGDAEAAEERWLLGRVAAGALDADALRADVLKVAHHGSRTSSTAGFLGAVRPRLALVSVGAGNSYRLPNGDVLARLRGVGAEVLRTDEVGEIVVRSNGRTLTVSAGGETWPVAGSRAR